MTSVKGFAIIALLVGHFAGDGAKRPRNWERTACGRRRGWQSRCTPHTECLRGYSPVSSRGKEP
jgi:hypothetical protein